MRLSPCTTCEQPGHPGRTCADAALDREAIRWTEEIRQRLRDEKRAELAKQREAAAREPIPGLRAALAANTHDEPERDRAGREES